jgi:hypothetical protein
MHGDFISGTTTVAATRIPWSLNLTRCATSYQIFRSSVILPKVGWELPWKQPGTLPSAYASQQKLKFLAAGW